MLKGSKVFTGTVVIDFDGKFCVLKKKGAVPRFVVIDCEESANGLKTLMGKATPAFCGLQPLLDRFAGPSSRFFHPARNDPFKLDGGTAFCSLIFKYLGPI